VTLKGPKGKVVTLTAGPDVRNLEQVKVGDHVVVGYLEACR
jgi:Zn-dependent alcohol dehydrogenase